MMMVMMVPSHGAKLPFLQCINSFVNTHSAFHTARSGTMASMKGIPKKRLHRDFSFLQCVTPTLEETNAIDKPKKRTHVGIVGGGLAGLSVAYHLLRRQQQQQHNSSINALDITILDKTHHPGEGGASAVAGGLLHPFSPRGKLLPLGMEALQSANDLIGAACRAQDGKTTESNIILRRGIYRAALTPANVQQLRETAQLYHPHWTSTFLSPEEMKDLCGAQCLGGVLYHGSTEDKHACRVIHVPSYLRGLWRACQCLVDEKDPIQKAKQSTVQWCIEAPEQQSSSSSSSWDFWKERLGEYDMVVLAAGAGMFQKNGILFHQNPFPIELVQGQSIELDVPPNDDDDDSVAEAVLCGKYITPTLTPDCVLVGATHEYGDTLMSKEDVWQELRSRSNDLSPNLWNRGTVKRITCGTRVQSHRTKHGRLPIVGKVPEVGGGQKIHDNAWIYTGLSSRGLLYHGLFGELLANAMWLNDEESMSSIHAKDMINWWK